MPLKTSRNLVNDFQSNHYICTLFFNVLQCAMFNVQYALCTLFFVPLERNIIFFAGIILCIWIVQYITVCENVFFHDVVFISYYTYGKRNYTKSFSKRILRHFYYHKHHMLYCDMTDCMVTLQKFLQILLVARVA